MRERERRGGGSIRLSPTSLDDLLFVFETGHSRGLIGSKNLSGSSPVFVLLYIYGSLFLVQQVTDKYISEVYLPTPLLRLDNNTYT